MVYNLLGQVRVVLREVHEVGYYRIAWDGKDAGGRQVASGISFFSVAYQLSLVSGGNRSITNSLIVNAASIA